MLAIGLGFQLRDLHRLPMKTSWQLFRVHLRFFCPRTYSESFFLLSINISEVHWTKWTTANSWNVIILFLVQVFIIKKIKVESITLHFKTVFWVQFSICYFTQLNANTMHWPFFSQILLLIHNDSAFLKWILLLLINQKSNFW